MRATQTLTLVLAIVGSHTVLATDQMVTIPRTVQSEAKNEPPSKRSPELQALVDAAGVCAPELRADVYLKLAPEAGLEDPQWRRDLIELAFADAGAAWLPYPLGAWHTGFSTDSDEGILAYAGESHLDGLTLRCRAIDQMGAIDPKRAIEMFETLDIRQATSKVPCEQTLVPDLRVYFDTLAALTIVGFTPKERARGDAVTFFCSHLSRLDSPIDSGPAIRAAADTRLDRTTAPLIVGALRRALEGSNADYSAFLWAARGCDLMSSYGKLRKLIRSDRKLDRDLIWSYRKFVTRNLSSSRCAIRGLQNQPGLPGVVQNFNSTVPKELAIRADEIVPASIVEFDYDSNEWWSSVPSRQALLAIQRLNSTNDGNERFTDLERASDSYRRLYADAVAKTEAWIGSDEANEDTYFQMKCLQYAALVEKAPSLELRNDALERYLHFISISSLARSKPAEWVLSLQFLLGRLNERDTEERGILLAYMLASREPAVRLYAELERRHSGGSSAH